MRVAIIGCGLIGRKRALALDPGDTLVACCDTNEAAARAFGSEFNCVPYSDYQVLIGKAEFDIGIVAVVNKNAKPIVISLLRSNKHVLAEKPLGRNAAESAEMLDALPVSRSRSLPVALSPPLVLKTGFNHRFHPAVWKAKELLDSDAIGRLFNIRAAYGHGGRAGMEKEWRASKDLCGGGELLDQGVHIIDLIRWFGGEIRRLSGKVETKFWDMEVEDNAYVIAETENNVSCLFHVSWTNWRNVFSFELFGTKGYLKINGLGGSYGSETLEIGRRKPEGGRPDIEMIEFPADDVSWKREWSEFKTAIIEKRSPIGNGVDGLRANLVIDAIYRSNKENKMVSLQI